MIISQKSIKIFSVLLTLFSFIVSCGRNHAKTVISEEAYEEDLPGNDTISIFQTLPNAPLITPREANRSNPSYTGYVSGWEKRINNAYADSIHQTLKTLVLEDPWAASETAEALRNDIAPNVAPVLLVIKWPLEYRPKNYWEQHSFDSAVDLTSFEPQFSMQYDCRFGSDGLKRILESSYPVELKDTTRFRPIIRIFDKEDNTLYSPLFECFYRGKPFLICSFDVDGMKSTEAGTYLWGIIRNYTYSDYFRNLMQYITIGMDYTTWFETLAPGYI